MSICPGKGFVQQVYDCLPQDPFTGICLEAYVGRATDSALYTNSQSGGIVSALLAHALQKGEIGAAVTAAMVEGNPPRPFVRLAKNIQEIKQAQKSKYAPVPLLTALEEIAGFTQPVAIVGVACQIHGLVNALERFPRLKGQIKYKVGLVCDRIMTFGAMDYLIKKAGLLHKETLMFHFRDKACAGYPGDVHITTSDGDSASLPASARMQIKDFFTPARCRLCFDKMNVFSDIVVCDPHGIGGVDRKGGESVTIIRTEAGRHLFKSALAQSALIVRGISYENVITGQNIHQKRSQWRGYTEAWVRLGRPLPNFVDRVREHARTAWGSTVYRKHIRQALILDTYPSRKDLVAAAEKYFCCHSLKKVVSHPFRSMRMVLGRARSIL
jgi:coenzyme F420 hydrogenase subunit beta